MCGVEEVLSGSAADTGTAICLRPVGVAEPPLVRPRETSKASLWLLYKCGKCMYELSTADPSWMTAV